MSSVFDILKDRGFIAQVTHEDKIRKLLEEEKVTFYIGFDPTADSLHVGHFLQMVVMAHMQRAGHRPIAIIGGGTAMVGDPSGRTDMRQMLTLEQIKYNGERFKTQLSKLVDFSPGRALMLNNADWLLDLNYVDFLREIGSHFSVNRMLTAECFKSRLEKGLSFIEFNYMLMQSYDYLQLFRDHGCKIQLGGDDQWSNILSGIDLVRRIESEEVYGMTFNLLTTSAGAKMGKTQQGAVWLDPEKTSPYDFYQYWRNVDDGDVINCLRLLTFVPIDEINELALLKDQEINRAKEVLAFEVTKLIHGEGEAQKADSAAKSLFGTSAVSDHMPSSEISREEIEGGIPVLDLLIRTDLVTSKSEGRRLINQGGLTAGDKKILSVDYVFTEVDGKKGNILLKKGKKNYHNVLIK